MNKLTNIKKSTLFGVASILTLSAHAQSSVTLYGIVDLGITYTNIAQTSKINGKLVGGSQLALTDAHTTGLTGSRWGLRGTEDLGGGLQAIFVVESGVMANNGTLAQGGALFGRQSYVEGRPGFVKFSPECQNARMALCR